MDAGQYVAIDFLIKITFTVRVASTERGGTLNSDSQPLGLSGEYRVRGGRARPRQSSAQAYEPPGEDVEAEDTATVHPG